MSDIFWQNIGNEALVISHYAIVPSIAVAVAKGFVAEAGMLLAMTLVSTVYHLCQAGYACALEFSVLQISDHFFVYSTLSWLILFFTDSRLMWRFVAFILIQGVLLPMIISFVHEMWMIGVAIGLPAIAGIFYLIIMRRTPMLDLLDLSFAVVLLGIGIFFHLYAGDPGTVNYAWAHSLWHVFCMLSIYFLFEAKDNTFWVSKLALWFRYKPKKTEKDAEEAKAGIM